MYYLIEAFFKKATAQFPVMLVTGARQVGKTTFLRHISQEKRAYVTLDDPLLLSLAKEDPALFMQRFPPPVLIDEIQYVPELLPYIKMEVDRNRKPGLYWLTGSQQFHLMKGVSEILPAVNERTPCFLPVIGDNSIRHSVMRNPLLVALYFFINQLIYKARKGVEQDQLKIIMNNPG